MKKFFVILLSLILVFTLVACGGKKDEKKSEEPQKTDTQSEEKSDSKEAEGDVKKVEKLSIYFVPSKQPDEIIHTTEPLKNLLIEEMKKHGFEIDQVDIQVGNSYETVGAAMEAGSADVGFIPGGTYVLYEDGADVILTATRAGLSKDSEVAKDWNDGKPTEPTDEQVSYYRSLLIAGPSEKGQELLAKVNSGEKLTAEDLKGAKWGHRSPTSSAGYIYPSIYLRDNYGLTLSDLPVAVETDSYGSSMARLAEETVDVITIYADARRDYVDKWTTDFNREKGIWEETGVIGVTAPIYNDTISVSKNSPIMTDEFKAALQDSFINIANTDEGKEVIKIYSHEGYKKAQASDYDKERDAQKILNSQNKR